MSLEPLERGNSPEATRETVAAVDVDTLPDDGFRTVIKSEPQASPEPSPRQPDYLDVTDMDVGDARPWLKAEPGSPKAVPDPVDPDAPVKEEAPVVRHVIKDSAPVLQDDAGNDVLLATLQPPQVRSQSDDLKAVLARQKLALGANTSKAILKQALEAGPGKVLQERVATKRRIASDSRELASMSGDERATYMRSLMNVDEDVPGKGRGVTAARDIPAFTVLAPYAGKVLNGEAAINQEWTKLGLNVPNYLFATKGKNAISGFGDGVGNISSLFNTGDTPSENNVAAYTLGNSLIYFMTERAVKAGEPLQFDYGPKYDTTGWENNPILINADETSDNDSDGEAPAM